MSDYRLSVNEISYSLTTQQLAYSPVLKTMMESGLGVTKDKAGQIILEDILTEDWVVYYQFLTGQDFTLTASSAALFDYLGHHNCLKYPLDYWAVKLRDNWIRDHFYSLELWREPFYGLVPVKKKRELPIKVPAGWYVAGGAALWLAGYIDQLADVDLFTCLPREEANQSLAFLNWDEADLLRAQPQIDDELILYHCHYRVTVTDNSISYREHSAAYLQSLVDSPKNPKPCQRYTVQFILRLYRSPSEIVHGFDLDSVGLLYDPQTDQLWATKRAIFSLQQQVNWFDPSRASPSYAYRLMKYQRRGFQLKLPLISLGDLNLSLIKRYFQSIEDEYQVEASKQRKIIFEALRRLTKAELVKQSLEDLADYLDRMLLGGRAGKAFSYCLHLQAEQRYGDPASLLILVAFFGFYPSASYQISDYQQASPYRQWLKKKGISPAKARHGYYLRQYRQEKAISNDSQTGKQYRINFQLLNWQDKDPMSQSSSLSGTFHPEPIPDLLDWYGQSPFYRQPVKVSVRDLRKLQRLVRK